MLLPLGYHSHKHARSSPGQNVPTPPLIDSYAIALGRLTETFTSAPAAVSIRISMSMLNRSIFPRSAYRINPLPDIAFSATGVQTGPDRDSRSGPAFASR